MENIFYYNTHKKSVLVCIFNHNDNENAERLLDIFSQRFDTKVFDSGSDIKNNRFILLDNIYYGGQYNLACQMMVDGGYDWLYCICSDVTIDDKNVQPILDSIDFVLQTNNVGTYSPCIRKDGCDYWGNFKNDTNELCLTNMINGFSIMVKRNVILKIKDKIIENKYGWGVDMLACYVTNNFKMLNVIDNKVEIFHPKGTSYDTRKANDEFNFIVKSYFKNYDLNNFKKNNNQIICKKINVV